MSLLGGTVSLVFPAHELGSDVLSVDGRMNQAELQKDFFHPVS